MCRSSRIQAFQHHRWLRLSGKCVRRSSCFGDFIPVEEVADINNCEFSVKYGNGESITLNSANLSTDIDSLIEELSKYFTFKIGDILFTGYADSNSFELSINDVIEGSINGAQALHFKVK